MFCSTPKCRGKAVAEVEVNLDKSHIYKRDVCAKCKTVIERRRAKNKHK